VGRAWGDFDAHEAVGTVTVVVHGSESISRQLDVLDNQPLDQRLVADAAVGIERAMQRVIVVGTAGNRLVEHSWVAGHAAQAVFDDQSAKTAAHDKAATDVVQPYELAVLTQCQEWVHKNAPSLANLRLTRLAA
jgi:hypothetical protein